MRLHTTILFAFLLSIAFTYAILYSTQVYSVTLATPKSLDLARVDLLVVHPLTTTTPTITPTPQTVVMPPTATITPGEVITDPTVVLFYFPALIGAEARPSGGGGEESCGPSISFSLTAEPTSTPVPTSAAAGGATATPTETATPAPTLTSPNSIATSEPLCPPNFREAALAHRIVTSREQRRSELRYSPLLTQIAREHAADMIARDYVESLSPDGVSANYRARNAGYRLPSFYSQDPDANSIETIMAGYTSAEEVWRALVSGPSDHVLGIGSFFHEQTEYGVGYAYNRESDFQRYWVIVIAKPGEEE